MSEWFGSRADSLPLGGLRVEIRPLMRNVYLWMFFGLLVTTVLLGAHSSPSRKAMRRSSSGPTDSTVLISTTFGPPSACITHGAQAASG